MTTAGEGRPTALVAFVVGSILAGGNAVGVRFSNYELDPFWGGALRFGLAAVLMLGVMAVMRLPVPRGRRLRGAIVYGVFNFGGAFAFAYLALVELHAGFAQILLSVVPLFTLLLAVLWRQERLRPAAIGGTLLALAGIVSMSLDAFEGSIPITALLAALGSSLCFAQAAVLVRRYPGAHPVAMNAVGMTVGTVVLLLGALVAGDRIVLPQQQATWVAIGYMVPVGSVLVFVLYLVVLRYWEASRAAYTFVVIPIVAVLVSAWLDNEPIGPGMILGGALVLLGVYWGALRQTESAVAQIRS